MATETTLEAKPVTGTVLVVDDEPSMREMLFIMLKREGYDVVLADCGKAAVEILRHRPVDLLISDIKMPDMSGVDVLRAAKQIDDAIVCIMITAFKSTESAVEALRLGAHDYLDKPFDVELLKKKVRQALEQRRLRTSPFSATARRSGRSGTGSSVWRLRTARS
jgi:two-component system response regulator PilR (NtrC family)